jgi:flotillin
VALAKGKASKIIESGKAQANGIEILGQSWAAAGDSAREIFIFQKLEPLLQLLAQGVPEVTVDSLTVIDAQDGGTATKLASFIEQMRQTTGVDLLRFLPTE